MRKPDKKEWWDFLNSMRSSGNLSGSVDLLTLAHAAEERGIKLDLDDFHKHAPKWSGFVELYTPEFITYFIAAYLSDSPPSKILDPCAGAGGTIGELTKRYNPALSLGIEYNKSVFDAAKIIHNDKNIKWLHGDATVLLDQVSDCFEAVVAQPPLAGPPLTHVFQSDNGPVEVSDEVGNIILLASARLLTDKGTGFFVLTPGFMQPRNSRSVKSNLERFGLYVDAALALPPGTFAPATQVAGLLVIIRRKKPAQLFVGELGQDLKSSEVLLANLKARREGKAPQLGVLIDPERFRSFPVLVAERDIATMAQAMGLEPRPLKKYLAGEIELADRQTGFEDNPNAVYLPLIGRSPAVASLAELHLKPQNYAQLILDPQQANAAYVAGFFNSPLGLKTRESLLSGSFIPKVNKTQLTNAVVYLPDINVQTEAVSLSSTITDLSTQLETLRRKLWSEPEKLQEIAHSLRAFDRGDSFDLWLDTLPYPLASILRTYDAAKRSEQKIEHLFHFFEGLSQWHATIMLSGFSVSPTFCAQEDVCLQEPNPQFRRKYQRPDFGAWNHLYMRLARELKRLHDDLPKRSAVLDLFGNPADEFVEMLIDDRLFSSLEEVRKVRNDWKGHGGILGYNEAKRRRAYLEEHLAIVRQAIADRYITATLVLPESLKYSEGVFHNTVQKLMGTRLPFKQGLLQALIPLDDKRLYLAHQNQLKPLELLPFVRMMQSPATQQNACYFYNKVEDGNVRWISYHFHDESDVRTPDLEVERAVEMLRTGVTSVPT